MAKKKRVLFFSGGEIDKDDQMHQWTVAKWSQLFTAIQRNAPEDNNVTHRGREYIATPHTSKSGEPYFRVTVARYKADWPDVETKDHAAPLSVKEYACVFPVPGYSYIAVFKSSAGPAVGALEALINSILETALTEGEFELQPVLRRNAKERLEESVGVSRITVRYLGSGLSGGFDEYESGSKIDRAVKGTLGIEGLSDADYSVSLDISLKRPKAVGPAQDALGKELRKLLKDVDPQNNGVIDKLQASVLHEKDDSKLQSEPIDFIRDRITETVEFGEDDDSLLTDSDIEAGVAKAIKAFKETIRNS